MSTNKKSGLSSRAVIGVVLAGVMLQAACSDECGSRKLAEYVSPDGQWRLVVFERDCGATTGFSTQASLLRPGEDLPNDGGNVFVADSGHGVAASGPGGGPIVDVRWESASRVLISHDPRARVFRAETRHSTVTLLYGILK